MSADDAHAAPPGVPQTQMPGRTLVRTLDGRQILWIDGVLPLPVGARIELAEPRADGVVMGVRVAAAQSGVRPTLVLDVRLEAPGLSGTP